MRTFWYRTSLATLAMACSLTVGCQVETAPKPTAGGGSGSGSKASGSDTKSAGDSLVLDKSLEGQVKIDGSSTVYPISAAVGEEFMGQTSAQVDVGLSGTGGGFKKFCRGETDISDASRPIKSSEAELAKENGIEFVELTVAIDGLSVVVHPENPIASITTEQLKTIWASDSEVKKWSDVDSSWPDEEIKLYGPDAESGTFDYFNEVILGKDASPRSDYSASSDDNQLLNGVAGDKFALAYFGYSYYINNKDRVKALAIAEGDAEPVAPTPETIEGGTYTPLARPLFIYVNKAKAADSPVLKAYLKYYVSEAGQEIVREEGFVELSPEALAETRKQVDELVGE